MSFRIPVNNGVKTQGFGADPAYYAKLGQKGHNGVDWGVPFNANVYAMDDGVVSFEGWGQNHSWMGAPAGICVLINHGGSYGGYAHLNSTLVNKGQRVSKGQLIGFAGATGTATGVHVHSEMLPLAPNFQNGYAGRVDITPYYEKTPVESEEIMNNPQDIRNLGGELWKRPVDDETVKNLTGKSWHHNMYYFVSAWPWTNRVEAEKNNADRVVLLMSEIDRKNAEIVAKSEEIEKLKKSSIDQETKDQIKNTNSIVTWIKEKLNSIFK